MKIPTFFKSLMTAIIFLLIPWEGKATGLSGDFIYLQGEEWELLAKPINRDSVLFHRLMEFCRTTIALLPPIGKAIPPIGKCSNLICICIIWKSVSMINRKRRVFPHLSARPVERSVSTLLSRRKNLCPLVQRRTSCRER